MHNSLHQNVDIIYEEFDALLSDIYDYATANNVTNLDYSYPFEEGVSFTLLELAIDFGNVAIVNLILANGANPNLQDEDGMTPLHLAISHNKSIEVVKCLLDYDADIYIQDKDGVSALDLLIRKYPEDSLVEILYHTGFF